MYTIYIELWKRDSLKATSDDALDGDQTGYPSVQSPMRYRLHQPALMTISAHTVSVHNQFCPLYLFFIRKGFLCVLLLTKQYSGVVFFTNLFGK